LSLKTLEQLANNKLRELEALELKRELRITERKALARTLQGEKKLISFSCNDYLGLSAHKEVIEASVKATREYGTGAGASRLITGNHPLFQALEKRLAHLKGTDDSVVFGSGYLAGVGVIPTLIGSDDLILIDELSHSCLKTGAKLTGGRILNFQHNNIRHAEELLQNYRKKHQHCLLITEGVFSMEGDLAPLSELSKLAIHFNAWLMNDDAHGLGVLGHGRGSGFTQKSPITIPLQMGTLSKAAGAYGGFICANQQITSLIRNRARTFVYTTGLPAGTVAAAIKALEIIERDPILITLPIKRAQLFTDELGLPQAKSAIVPIIFHTPEKALVASQLLEKKGFLVTAIRPPSVPRDTARLRCTFSAAHSEEDVLEFASAIRPLLKPL